MFIVENVRLNRIAVPVHVLSPSLLSSRTVFIVVVAS